ncbi:signal recognition particle-docking protein FtsY [Paramaledivibacter caminithermalis]|jgi:fused signal recognition particle receptor|uniref:Signal recognition particle receptor FtsY n=1 Tax=Paramaledivibacter caminithermalis (strain DSM 15212 / CIP 107654 / DViRD3) TaxID=1121301 RepID=A0A1M6NJX9_PARC5|nr:signal recognition particle-docking protein FtsY [Paramaledivibacter caminithermalis]SHJ95862.1 signal recognition particle-docking protein FtsY [Paramaledivibacter caminithermalis DSM 15212]
MLKKLFGKIKKNNEETLIDKGMGEEDKSQEEISEGEFISEDIKKASISEDNNKGDLKHLNDELEEAVESPLQNPEDDANIELESKKNSVNFFSKLKLGLTKTRKGITEKIDSLMKIYTKVDEEFLEELEEILIVSDVGMSTTMEIIDKLRSEIKTRKISDTEEVKAVLKDIMEELLTTSKDNDLNISPSPAIIIVIGVNGVGKTTSIGKIAYNVKASGKKVLLAAGDTFRAAAIDQLKIWGERVGVNVIHQQEGSDPAAIIYDAIQAAKARKTDVLICDTAGRLHNKRNLMNELGKVFKIINREYPEARKEVLLVLDATTGQNAIQQAKTFKEVADITGIVLTKLDGTAKGGVILGVTSELDIPVKFVGVGEGIQDLQPFNPKDFVEALLSDN